MRRRKKHRQNRGTGGFEQLSSSTDFYAGSPAEKPLYQDRPVTDVNRVRKTARHQAVGGRRKETVDPREKMALIAILRATIAIIFLLIAFFMLWKGIKLYEENIWMDNQQVPEVSPVMREVALVDDFDISVENAPELFSQRIELWKESERMVRSVEGLLLRNNYDQAIERCQDALRLDPANIGALEYLGELYLNKGMYVQAVNTYIRLLSVDPSRADLQLALLKSLDAYGDSDATIQVAHWYQEQNTYNEDVQRYMANAYFRMERYAEAASAYERSLKDNPRDVNALENQAVSYMRLDQYGLALATLEKLVVINLRDPSSYKRIAICNAQLGNATETVQVLGKSAHLFGPDTVIMWIQDPRMDPVRLDRAFQAFTDRVGGEEFRKYLEKMAQSMDATPEKKITPQLELPDTEAIDAAILRPRQ